LKLFHENIYAVINGCARSSGNINPNTRIILNDYDLHYVIEGEGVLIFDNDKVHLRQHDAIILHPGQHFYVKNLSAHFDRYYIHFDLYHTAKRRLYDQRNCDPPPPKLIKEPFHPASKNFSNHPDFPQMLAAIIREFHDFPAPARLFRTNVLLNNFIQRFLNCTSHVSENHIHKTNAHLRKLIGQARMYLEQYYHKKINIRTLSSRLGLSTNYFINIFKDINGKTPYDFLQNIRIENAKIMLIEGSKSIQSIAVENGFGNQQHFSSYFKRCTGLTPGKYSACISNQYQILNSDFL